MIRFSRLCRATIFAGISLLSCTAFATERFWSGGGGSDNINDGGNWFNGTPNVNDDLTWNNTTGAHHFAFFNYGDFFTFGQIHFFSGANGGQLYGDALKFTFKLENSSDPNQWRVYNKNVSVVSSGGNFQVNPVGGDLYFKLDNSTGTGSSSNGSFFFDGGTMNVFGNNNKLLTFENILADGSASGSFILQQNSQVRFTGTVANSYTGTTTINAGTLYLSKPDNVTAVAGNMTIAGGLVQAEHANQFATGSSVTINSGTFDLNAHDQKIDALNGTGGTVVNNNTSAFLETLTVGQGNGSGSYAGSIANHSGSGTGLVALTKAGTGTQTLTSNNPYSGTTTINAGTLKLANTGGVALSGTSNIVINNGGTLLMGANNQINQAILPPIALGTIGGTGTQAKIDAGGFSQGTGGTPVVPNSGTVGLGKLTLNSSSIIDMTGTSVLHFSNSNSALGNATWTGILSIYDWSGTAVTGGGSEQILFGGDSTGLSPTQLAEVQFFSGAGTGAYTAGAVILADGEIVPVPEPSTSAAGIFAVGGIGFSQRRRFARLLKFA